MRLKKCSLCSEEKTINNYWKHGKAKDGLYAHCKNCHTLQSRKTREKYREKYREKARKSVAKWRRDNPEIAKERNRIYQEKNKEKYYNSRKERYRQKRLEVLKNYGNKCICCGEKNFMFLALDHKNNDGNKHRKIIKQDLTLWAYKNSYPKILQILCHNCNMAKGIYGKCPHRD